MSGELGHEKRERPLPDGATPAAVLINAFAETLEGRAMGRRWYCSDKPASQLDAVGASCFHTQSENGLPASHGPPRDPWPGPGTPAPIPEQPAWAPALVHAEL